MVDKPHRAGVSNADPTEVLPDSPDAAYWIGFGERLKKFRNEAGLTQKQLADKMQELDSSIQVSQSSLSQVETGKKRMGLNSVRVAADVLGVPIALLLSDKSLDDAESQAIIDLFKILEHRGTATHSATLTTLRAHAKALEG